MAALSAKEEETKKENDEKRRIAREDRKIAKFGNNWKEARWIFFTIMAIDILALTVGFGIQTYLSFVVEEETTSFIPIAGALAIVVVTSFGGTLIAFNRLSASPTVTKGEMRKSIAFTIIMLHILVVIVAFLIPDLLPEDSTLIGNFTNVAIIVVSFYFGGRTAKQIVNVIKGGTEDDDE